jgi:hypothetical protein
MPLRFNALHVLFMLCHGFHLDLSHLAVLSDYFFGNWSLAPFIVPWKTVHAFPDSAA